jgi:tetratricopeptide (TPR) repeat protein
VKYLFRKLVLIGIALLVNACARMSPEATSVAVAPFQRLSEGEVSDYVTHAVPASVGARLSGIDSLGVVTLGDGDPVELGVERILQGSVSVSQDEVVRVTVQLYDPAQRASTWGPKVYEQPRSEVFRLESTIAREVANALEIDIRPAEALRLERQPTENGVAYELYMRALYLLHTLAAAPASVQAEMLLRQSLVHDPDFALAYTGLAVLYMGAGRTEDAESAASRALALNPDEAEAHWVMGWLHEERREWSDAEAAFAAGVRLSPSSSTLLARYARIVSWFGRFEEAQAIMMRALRVDPRSWVRHMYAANVARMARDFRQSIALQDKMVELEPLSANRADVTMLRLLSYVGSGDCRLALAVAGEQTESARLFAETSSIVTYVYGRCGERALAMDDLGRLKTMLAEDAAPAAPLRNWYLTLAYLGVGDDERALAALKRSFDEGVTGPPIPLAPVDPFWDPVRDDARFIALAERLDLPTD